MHSSPSLQQLDRPAPWRMPVLVKASLACHLGAGAAVLAEPALWPWSVGALAVDHAFITGAGLWPRSSWLGSNMCRLPESSAARREIAITIDDGPDPEVTPAMLDLLDAHGARATFFCIAARAEAHARLCREIVERGHSVQNHTHRHSHTFAFSGPRAFGREIDAAQDAFAQVTGIRPVFFRAPAGFRNMFLDSVLHERGLQLVSWTRRGFDTVRRDPAVVLKRLTRDLAAGDILLLHDGGAQRAPNGRAVSLEVLPQLLQRIAQAGLSTVTLPQAVHPETPA